MTIDQSPAYLGDGKQAFPEATVARWPEHNRAPMTVKLFTAEQVAAAVSAERERCAKKAAPEHIPFSDDEWRVRCEVRDSILEA